MSNEHRQHRTSISLLLVSSHVTKTDSANATGTALQLVQRWRALWLKCYSATKYFPILSLQEETWQLPSPISLSAPISPASKSSTLEVRMGLVWTCTWLHLRASSSLPSHLWLVYSRQTEASHWLLPRINAAAAAQSSGLLPARVNFRQLCQFW